MKHNPVALDRLLRAQKGQILLFLLLLIGLGAAVFSGFSANSVTLANERTDRTAQSMAMVREALIGWSISRNPLNGTGWSSNDRPGELPCPDTGNNANPGDADGTCIAGRLGRVPWRTLGIPEPKDGDGETLWYTLAGPFRRSTTPTSNQINSDTKGAITVYGSTTANILTNEAIAVIFAPGSTLETQQRDTTSVACTTTGTTIPRWRCAANYLETSGGINNATTNGPFITGTSAANFNDRMLVVTTADLMPLVEKRVARDLITLLGQYKTATATLGYTSDSGPGVYPWPDVSTGASDPGLNRGRIPAYDALAGGPYALPIDWGTGGAPNLPQWFNDNGWRRLIYYAVADNQTDRTISCTTCTSSTLRVRRTCSSSTGQVTAQVILITPGAAGAGRPLSYPWTNWSSYIEDGCNNDNSDDTFISPTSTAKVRDQLFTIP